MHDTTTTFDEYLKSGNTLTYRIRGVSMRPMLRQEKGDLVTIVPKTDERCKKYDVALYKRPPDQYVLHRVVEVREKDYVILGDNCFSKEYGFTDNDIIGVMSAFHRGGKTYSTDNKLYKAYSKIWYFLYPARKVKMKAKSRIYSSLAKVPLLRKIKKAIFN